MSRLPDLGPNGEGWVAVQLVLLPLVALAGVFTGGAWGGGAALVTTLAGLALMVAGAALGARGILDLGRSLTPMPRPRDDAELVESGVYRLVRHPIYGGVLLTALGWGLAAASPLALGLAVVLGAFFDLKSRREEAWLVQRYPDYPDYAARTHRLIPLVY